MTACRGCGYGALIYTWAPCGVSSQIYTSAALPLERSPVYLNVGWDIWLRIGKMTGCFEDGNEPSGFIQCVEMLE
jgi:hypothetical protein